MEARLRDLGKELRLQKGLKKTASKTAKESREEVLKVRGMEPFVMQLDKVWSFNSLWQPGEWEVFPVM